jgi:hypothetical protein
MLIETVKRLDMEPPILRQRYVEKTNMQIYFIIPSGQVVIDPIILIILYDEWRNIAIPTLRHRSSRIEYQRL